MRKSRVLPGQTASWLGQTEGALLKRLLLRRHNKLALLQADDKTDFTPPVTENKRLLRWYGAAEALHRASGARHEAAATCMVGLVQAREASATHMTRPYARNVWRHAKNGCQWLFATDNRLFIGSNMN